MRTIFGKSIRKETTEFFYPDKLTCDQFINNLENDIKGFKENLKTLDKLRNSELFIEEWIEYFLAWSEIEDE